MTQLSDPVARDTLHDLIIGLGGFSPRLDRASRTADGLDAQLLRSVFDSTLQFIGVLDIQGVVVEVNRPSLTYAGAVADQVRGRPFWELAWWEADDRAPLQAMIRRAAAGMVMRREFFLTAPTGRRVAMDFSLSPLRSGEGAVRYLIAEGRDITEYKELERLNGASRDLAVRLAGLSEMDQALQASLGMALALTGLEHGCCLLAQPDGSMRLAVSDRLGDRLRSALETLAADEPAIPGLRGSGPIYLDRPDLARSRGQHQHVAALLHTHDPGLTAAAAVPIGEGAEACLLVATSRHNSISAGARAALEMVAAQAAGAIPRIAGELERRRLEGQLRQMQKMDAVGQLAGGIAHDFNNMLGAILGGAELLGRGLGQDPKQRRLLAMITEATERASSLTRKLLSVSRKSVTVKRHVDLHEVVRETVALLERSIDRRISIRIQPDATRSVVDGDLVQLQSVILNLGLNARDAMPEGGQLLIATSDATIDPDALQDGALAPGAYIRLSIRDTGTGMPPEIVERIFEPFFTTKDPGRGTGLGLAMVYGTVKEHHGSIAVESAPGCGSAFHIRLPIAGGTAASASATDDELVEGSGHILVIDDEPALRALSCRHLQEMGYSVFQAGDGREGVEVFQANRAVIDAVLLDMVMPRMNGRECFHALRAIDGRLPIILTSGFDRDLAVDELRRQGAAGFISKPYRSAELSRLIATALASRTAG